MQRFIMQAFKLVLPSSLPSDGIQVIQDLIYMVGRIIHTRIRWRISFDSMNPFEVFGKVSTNDWQLMLFRAYLKNKYRQPIENIAYNSWVGEFIPTPDP